MADKGFIVYASYMVEEKKPYIVLYGRLENGKSFKTISRFDPYFYINEDKTSAAKRLIDATFLPQELNDFSGAPVSKVTVCVPSDVRKAREVLEAHDIECFEADIPFETRFLIDNDIRGYVSIEGNFTSSKRIDRVYINPSLTPCIGTIELSMLSIDIETSEKALDSTTYPIYSIALYTKDYEEVLIVGKTCDNATSYECEKDLLVALKKKILLLDPDILIGWNIVDFDLVYLASRYKAYGIEFDIGREEGQIRLLTEHSFIRASRAQVAGRMVLDGMHLLRDFFYKFEDYRLDTAGKAILSEGKKELKNSISYLYESDPQTLAEYNLQDTKIVYKIMENENLIKIAMTLSSITGMMLDRVKASIATLDSLYIRNARKDHIVCPSVKNVQRSAVIGGHVEEPKSGIYDYVLLFDFRSLYPSIIATFNIDPMTYGKGRICAPNGACFNEGHSILPHIILDLLKRRSQAKKDKEYTKQFAIKIIMNSIFGVLGNPHCRFHNADIANAVTSFGRNILKETRSKVQDLGYSTIYGDTDSIFVVSNATRRSEAEKIGNEIEATINNYYDRYIEREYGRKSHLHLEFEKVYDKFFLPRQRHDEKGAKKRYAGMVDGTLNIVGLEYVRRDWTLLAKEFQYSLLKKVFSKEDYKSYIASYVSKLRKGELEDKLIYKKRLRKPIDKYTKTTPPHVKAAKLLKHKEKDSSALIEYIMTKKGPQPVQVEGAMIDYSHYLNKQLRPIAESILVFLDVSFDDIIASSDQKKITDYI